jgi:hypothetical protein
VLIELQGPVARGRYGTAVSITTATPDAPTFTGFERP